MFTRMVKMTKYEQHCRRKHNLLAAEAVKLEIMAFSRNSEKLWKMARHIRYKAMDYVQIRFYDKAWEQLMLVCRRTGKIMLLKDMVYLMNVGNISKDALTQDERKHSIYCNL